MIDHSLVSHAHECTKRGLGSLDRSGHCQAPSSNVVSRYSALLGLPLDGCEQQCCVFKVCFTFLQSALLLKHTVHDLDMGRVAGSQEV